MIFEQKSKDYSRDLQIIKRAIEEKLKLHDRLNKQLAKLIEMAGGNEDDPLQRKVKKETLKTNATLKHINYQHYKIIYR